MDIRRYAQASTHLGIESKIIRDISFHVPSLQDPVGLLVRYILVIVVEARAHCCGFQFKTSALNQSIQVRGIFLRLTQATLHNW
jgi:hypothetical protein